MARACADESLWGTDLGRVPSFVHTVAEHLVRIQRSGVDAALGAHLEAPSDAADLARDLEPTG